MGGDGAVALNRRADFERRAESDGKTKLDERDAAARRRRGAWRYCGLSRRLLWPPVVADRRGNLYRKDSVVALLVARKAAAAAAAVAASDAPATAAVTFAGGADAEAPAAIEDAVDVNACAHIKKLRDVRELVFVTRAPPLLAVTSTGTPAVNAVGGARVVSADVVDAAPEPSSESDVEELVVCPVTGQIGSGGRFPFVFFWECGHVVSQAALVEDDTADASLCPWEGCTARSRTIVTLVADPTSNEGKESGGVKDADSAVVGEKRRRDESAV